jgi:integrase
MDRMGRRRTRNHHLPPLMIERAGRYYYGRNQAALGADFPAALRRYAELHGAAFEPQTFSAVAAEYLLRGTRGLAPKTVREYERQMPTLVRVFGAMPLPAIRPVHVRRYLTARGDTVAGTREKALLSAVFSYARNAGAFDGANPCAGIKGVKARRSRYVTDDEFAAVLAVADSTLRDFLELAYYTGQRPSDVLRMRRQDVQDGALAVQQGKTGAKVRIAVVGPLDALLARVAGYPVGSVYLVRDERGQRLTLSGIRKRFWIARKAAGQDWQIRDLRAKAASDSETALKAQGLLGHAAATTTDGYIRRTVGAVVQPILRELPALAGKAK